MEKPKSRTEKIQQVGIAMAEMRLRLEHRNRARAILKEYEEKMAAKAEKEKLNHS